MAVTLDDKLVVAISSRALFDFEEENRIFDALDPRPYMELQQERLHVPAKPGVAFALVRKLLAFNTSQARRVEVVLLSRNDPVSALRIFNSAKDADLPLERGVFTQGSDPFKYLRPLGAHLFLSANEKDVSEALALQVHVGAVVVLLENAVLFLKIEQRARGDRDYQLVV